MLPSVHQLFLSAGQLRTQENFGDLLCLQKIFNQLTLFADISIDSHHHQLFQNLLMLNHCV